MRLSLMFPCFHSISKEVFRFPWPYCSFQPRCEASKGPKVRNQSNSRKYRLGTDATYHPGLGLDESISFP